MMLDSSLPTAFAERLESALRVAGSPQRAVAEKAYLKSELEFFGTGMPATRAAVKAEARAHPRLEHDQLCAVVELLWSRPIHECRMAAVELLILRLDGLDREDLALVERLIRHSHTWALVDPLAANVAGSLVQRYPELTADLDRWSSDPDFWIRRASMLAYLLPLRRTADPQLFARFGRYADAMLDEREFFIRKAIGWVLREVSKVSPGLVVTWLQPRVQRASGVTLREAVKYLPEADRATLLQQRGAG
jgi:3-methyladenine DNA glycosylase AlkD